MVKIKVKRGAEANLPTFDEGEPGLTTDTKRVFFGTNEGNVELAKKEELGDLSVLPEWLQENLSFAVKALYDSMTEINVRTPPYNLKGDGTDELSQIQALFNLARDNGRVYLRFPNGVYGADTTGSYIRIYKNTFVKLDDGAEIRRLGTGNKLFINGELGNASYVSGGYNGEGNIHFTGGTINLNITGAPLATTTTISAFDLGHAENLSFLNVTVKNGQIGHYYQVSSCRNVLFRDCWFGNVNYTDTSSTAYELIQIEVATATSFPSFGAYDLTISKDVYIEDCSFDTVIRAVGNHSDGMYGTGAVIRCQNIQIRGCTFRNSFDNMLNLTAFKDSVFENNTIDTVGAYGIYLNVCEDNVFRNNRVFNSQKAGMHFDSSHRNRVKDMLMREVALSNTYSAFRLISSNDNIFDDNSVLSDNPNYSYAFFTSGGCTGTKLRNYNFNKGKSGTISGDFTLSNNLVWCSVGDSITRGNNNGNGYFQDYALPMMPKIITHYNRGYGGYTASIPGTVGAYNSIKDVMTDIEVADVYTVELGTNDFSRSIPVGTTADATGKTDSFWGGLKQLYIDLTTKNMNALIILITPSKRIVSTGSTIDWNTANTAGFKLTDYAQALKDFGSQYGLPVIDWFGESGISSRTAPTFLYDGLHPNLDTNKRLGKMVGNKINQYI